MNSLALLGYPASLVMGLALGLTGGGGSILTVPILVYLFGIDAIDATAYSLGLVGLVALWGAWGAYRSGDLQLKRALSFGIPGVVGVLVSRRILLPQLPEQLSVLSFNFSKSSVLLICFAALMLLASTSMIYASREKPTSKTKGDGVSKISHLSLVLGGLGIGLLAGFVGAGGGFLIVPTLVNIGKLNMKQAVGTSLFVIALQSLLCVLGDFAALAKINAVLFVSIVVIAIIGMTWGTHLRKSISASKLKLIFGVFVFVMGSLILFSEITKKTV